MGSKSAGPGGVDVQPFDMPPMQQPTQANNIPWINNGLPPEEMRNGRYDANSPMGQWISRGAAGGIGGQGTPPQMSPEDQIRMMYMSQLGRAPEQGGMDYWRQQMQGGMTPDQIRDAFRSSQEGQAYQQRMRPMTDDFGYGRQQQMPPEVLDALRLAQQRQQETPTYDPRVVQQQNPSVSQALALLGRLFG